MILTLIIKSKHQKSFLIYLFILYIILNKLNLVRKLINKNNKIIKFALLKSPHINKTSQQHFGFNIYRKKVIIFLTNISKFVLLTKLFIYKLFYDLHINIIYNLLKKAEVNTIKYYFINFTFKIIKLNAMIKKVSNVLYILHFNCLKELLKLITQWKSVRLINEKLTVQFCFS